MHLKYCSTLLLLSLYLLSCSRDEKEIIVPIIEEPKEDDKQVLSSGVFNDIAAMDINVDANGNYWGGNDFNLVKHISGSRYSYCHPDVEYFPNGFRGYKF